MCLAAGMSLGFVLCNPNVTAYQYAQRVRLHVTQQGKTFDDLHDSMTGLSYCIPHQMQDMGCLLCCSSSVTAVLCGTAAWTFITLSASSNASRLL